MFTKSVRAFTLVEILVIIAIAGVVGAIAYGAYRELVPTTHNRRVESDVGSLNRSIESASASGITIPDGATAQDAIALLKAVPTAQLAREVSDVKARVGTDVGLSPYTTEDGLNRMVFTGGKFVTATTGSGYILDNSGNVAAASDTRVITGAKFATTSKWVWDRVAAAAPPSATTTVNLATNAPLVAGNYTITTPGTYTFTATTPSTSGTLSIFVGPYSQGLALSSGNQSISQTITVGQGAKFMLPISAEVAGPGGSANKSMMVTVNVAGSNPSTPQSLVINGANAVTVKRSDGSHTEAYTWTLAYSDGTFTYGNLTDPSQGVFAWRSDVPGDSRVIRETQSGISAEKNVSIRYIPAFTVTLSVNDTNGGTAVISAPNAGPIFDQGTAVTLASTPNSGWVAQGFGGDLSSPSSSFTFTLLQNVNIVANFIRSQYTLTATPDDQANGSVTGGGTYNSGDTATLTATPAAGKKFVGWGGPDAASIANAAQANTTIVMSANRTVVATFADRTAPVSLTVSVRNGTAPYTISLTVQGPKGTVTFAAPAFNIQSDVDFSLDQPPVNGVPSNTPLAFPIGNYRATATVTDSDGTLTTSFFDFVIE